MTGPRLRQNHPAPVTHADWLAEKAEREAYDRGPVPGVIRPERCVVCGHETTAGDMCLTCDTGRRHG